jgi:hypothetical protein
VLPTLTLYPAVGAAIISSGPTNFIGITGTDFTGDACWNSPAGTLYCGGYGYTPPFSVTGLPGTSSIGVDINTFTNSFIQMDGTATWTAVEDYPASPELIGTFAVRDVSGGDPNSPYTAEFDADFPVGSVDPINLVLLPNAITSACREMAGICFTLGSTQIVTPAPEPASLSILGVALGIFLMARRSVRRPTRGPSQGPARA